MNVQENFAQYHLEQNPRYRNNILVRALPPLPTDEDIFNTLVVMPREREAAFRSAPLHYRLDSLSELQEIFVPFARHVDAFRSIFSAMRACYLDRDPSNPRVIQHIMQAMSGRYTNMQRMSQSGGGNGIVLSGCTGVGKTTFIDRLIHNFLGTAVVYHTSLNDRPCRWPQIKWLRVQAPSTVSLAWLAESVADEVDSILDTRFGRRFNSQVATSKYIYEMARATSTHLLGLLIVDDTQNIQEARGTGDKFVKILCSFMELTGIPVLLITTYKALPTIMHDTMYASKLKARGMHDFPAFDLGDDWDTFVEALWAAHPFPHESLMPVEFPAMLHWHTQGVLRIAREAMVELFKYMATNKKYIPTMDMLDNISGSSLLNYQDEISVLRKLKEGVKFSTKELMNFSDFIPPQNGFHTFMTDVRARESQAKEKMNRVFEPEIDNTKSLLKKTKSDIKKKTSRKALSPAGITKEAATIARSPDPYEACVKRGLILQDVLELR